MASKTAPLEFSFDDISLEEAAKVTAVKRVKVSQWRKVIDAFLASDKDAAVVHVDNGKSTASQAASINQQLRKATDDALEAGSISEGETALPVKVRPREVGVVFMRTDRTPAKAAK